MSPCFAISAARCARYADAKERQEADGSAGNARGGALRLPPAGEIDRELKLGGQGIVPFGDHRFRASSEVTPAEKQQFENDLRMDPDLARALSETRRLGEESLLDDEFLEPPDQTAGQARGLGLLWLAAVGDVLGKVIERRVRRTDHGFYPTIVEEILRRFYVSKLLEWSWSAMKDYAADAFAPEMGGRAILAELKKHREAGGRRRVVLVGHSAGSIWICQLLRKAAGFFPVEDFEVVFLAPACTFALFKSVLDTVGPDTLKIRSFAMKNELEIVDRMGGMVYPRSLLYFVSGVLEQEVDMPLLGMHRYFSEKAPYTETPVPEVVAFLNRGEGRLVWSPTEDVAHGGQAERRGLARCVR